MCGNGLWGRVCNRLQYWGPENARVVCRQLGYSDTGTLKINFIFTCKVQQLLIYFLMIGAYVVEDDALPALFGVSERAPLLGEVHCIGNEQELFECSHSALGRHACGLGSTPIPDIAISCFGVCMCTYTQLCTCVLHNVLCMFTIILCSVLYILCLFIIVRLE